MRKHASTIQRKNMCGKCMEKEISRCTNCNILGDKTRILFRLRESLRECAAFVSFSELPFAEPLPPAVAATVSELSFAVFPFTCACPFQSLLHGKFEAMAMRAASQIFLSTAYMNGSASEQTFPLPFRSVDLEGRISI